MATAPNDQFATADASIQEQRLAALELVATHGRQGLEDLARSRTATAQDEATGTAGLRSEALGMGQSEGAAAEIAALMGGTAAPYVTANERLAAIVAAENAASTSMLGNFFTQVQQAVPMYRSEAQRITAEYKAAYDERQRQIAAEARRQAEAKRQAELVLKAQQDAQAQAAAIHAAQMEQDRQALLAAQQSAAAAAAQAAAYQAAVAAPAYNPYAPGFGTEDDDAWRLNQQQSWSSYTPEESQASRYSGTAGGRIVRAV